MVYDCGYNTWMGGWPMIFMALFWVAVIVLVIWALNRFTKGNDVLSNISGKSADEIAKERYAKGEITKKEFEDIKKELRKS